MGCWDITQTVKLELFLLIFIFFISKSCCLFKHFGQCGTRSVYKIATSTKNASAKKLLNLYLKLKKLIAKQIRQQILEIVWIF